MDSAKAKYTAIQKAKKILDIRKKIVEVKGIEKNVTSRHET